MREAQHPKYTVDGWFLKHFRIWPDGCDPSNFTPEQKKFAVYLVASCPSDETFQHYVRYEARKDEIMQTDFRDDVRKSVKSPQILETMARARGLTVERYVARQAVEARRLQLHKLKEQFSEFLNLDDEETEDPRMKVLQHYAEMAKKLNIQKPDAREANIRKLFDKPEQLRPVTKPDGPKL